MQVDQFESEVESLSVQTRKKKGDKDVSRWMMSSSKDGGLCLGKWHHLTGLKLRWRYLWELGLLRPHKKQDSVRLGVRLRGGAWVLCCELSGCARI